MLFNSIEFIFFLPSVFFLYWFVTNKCLKAQNALLVLASYFFYGWWDWKFLLLIFFSSVVDFFVGINMSKTKDKARRKLLLFISVFVNLSILGFFKYFNFFVDSFVDAFTLLGQQIDPIRLNIILPVGISFYTFQTLSYSIDVYKKKLAPTHDPIAFFAFVSFFPQLVAGPIERASNLLPQFYKKRVFNNDRAIDGLRQILWGLVKKVVIADNAALFANQIFENSTDYSGSTLLLGAIFFTFQIYGDFSGYSDIAIGTARLFGFNLMQNFAFPYFSRDIAEFWRRWHISLSTWFRDYVYIPLGGSRGGQWSKIRNTFIIFLVSGFWHGANWTFLAWGFLNACYFLPLLLLKKNRQNTNNVAENRWFPTFKELFQIAVTFFLTVIAWVFFRAENLSMAFGYLDRLFSPSLLQLSTKELSQLSTLSSLRLSQFIPLVIGFIIVEWIQREKQHGLELDAKKIHYGVRWVFYYSLILLLFFYKGASQEFIYFQF